MNESWWGAQTKLIKKTVDLTLNTAATLVDNQTKFDATDWLKMNATYKVTN